ncbi:ATP-binding cassette domain-containing protein [Nocardiopsis sp. CT-R113]|uniref:ATP-binding cassette domain-containing protein n=1 Tax=Nocardiopsis codii TaxID=3065942 RepID=A0ABU7KHJ6_9ACTN|nr:ATP-binding cassette domain-containing protein [Nocardiopsis sp. CT-R113]MEE2041711.1 ATP-binding cassette domain-containing protein [Nocardiopsis sp. CT-R113]
MNTPHLSVHHLNAGYGRARVLFDINLTITTGTIACIMGRNGVGKTTLLNTIAGLITPTTGTITHNGTDITHHPPHTRIRNGIAYAPQGHDTFAPLTVAENLHVAHHATKRGGPELIDAALHRFPRLQPLLHRRAGLLSGGQAQQLAIARALVTNPTLLILDEPTEGIQPSIVAEIEQAITDIAAEGITVLLVEQYLDVALRLADTVTVIDAGHIIHSGNRTDLTDETAHTLMAI